MCYFNLCIISNSSFSHVLFISPLIQNLKEFFTIFRSKKYTNSIITLFAIANLIKTWTFFDRKWRKLYVQILGIQEMIWAISLLVLTDTITCHTTRNHIFLLVKIGSILFRILYRSSKYFYDPKCFFLYV